MFYWTIRWILVSLSLIFLVHYLYAFFKTTLTVPKIRDLVNKPTEKYNEMLNTVQQPPKIDQPNKEDMQIELQNFLKDLKRPDVQNITAANEVSNTKDAFSSY